MANVLGHNHNVTNIPTDRGSKRDRIFNHQHKRRHAPPPQPPTHTLTTSEKIEKAKFSLGPRYKITEVLGQGSYGTVCAAIDTKNKSKNAYVAIKKVTDIFKQDVLLKRAVREMKLMRFFRGHRNIISLVDVDIVYNKPYDGLYCFQELCSHDLAIVIHSGLLFTQFHIQSFMYQILCGLKYIHSAEVIHRDLKPGNILVTLQGILKICDFGLARGIAPHYYKRSFPQPITNYVATRWYRAPELLLSKRTYTKAIDMWAVGCILAELYGRKPLFPGKDLVHQAFLIAKVLGTPPKSLVQLFGSTEAWDIWCPPNKRFRRMDWKNVYPYASSDALELMDHLMCWDPRSRYTVTNALKHPFLRDVRDLSDEPICDQIFDFGFEGELKSMNDYKKLIHDEVESFKLERLGKPHRSYLAKKLYL